MQITRQADYAVRAVLYLAQLESGTRTSTAQIAREQKIPPTFLAKIIAQLSVAGIIQTIRGAHGGVTLARPADEISLLEIVEVVDGPILLNACVADPQVCPLSDGCPIQKVWCEAQTELMTRLAKTKFSQLALTSESPSLPGLR
jgi:Rrf2 family protein